MLNVKEQRLITIADKFEYLNEALAMIKNKINLTNVDYLTSTEQSITVVPGTSEYLLPNDFADLVYVAAQNGPQMIDDQSSEVFLDQPGGNTIPYISVKNLVNFGGSVLHHYIRNRYIGFAPTPTTGFTAVYRYKSKGGPVTSVSTYIDLPDNMFYAIKDWMMYRACLKFSNPLSNTYLQNFTNNINLYITTAAVRDSNLDKWGILSSANT